MTTLPPEDPHLPGSADGAGPPAPAAPVPPAAPAAPADSGPQAPPAPGYQAPPQQGYQAPPQQGYSQPAGGYQQAPASDPVSTITLNYWLSVFFTWIPALIFFLIEKDKGNQQAYAFHRDNLNFALLRVIVGLVGIIPYIGWVVAVLGGIVLFVFHIMAAAKAGEAYRTGQKPPFIFNIPMIK